MGCFGIDTQDSNNYITAEFEIGEGEMDEKVQIINSADNLQRLEEDDDMKKDYEPYKNEESIKQCKITINDEVIPFLYQYEFKKPGKYTIKYIFPNIISQTSYLFYNCTEMEKVDLTKFNTKNLTCMYSMFCGCMNLEDVIFFNNKLEKVTNMDNLFMSCKSLENFNLTNLTIERPISMNSLFTDCAALENVDLSNLKAKVTSMAKIFFGCYKLKNVNLSNLNTDDLEEECCENLFKNCALLKKENVITDDQRILDGIFEIIDKCSF